MADRRRVLTPRVRHSSPAFCRAGHAPWMSWRRSRALKPPRACPIALAAPFAFPFSFLRAHGDRNTVTPPSQIQHHRAPLTDSSKPQPRREPLYACNTTATPFSPQVELTASAAPPGRHDRRRPSARVAVLLEPLPSLSPPCAGFCELY